MAHGEALSIIYPAFSRFTWASDKTQFAAIGRIFDPALCSVLDDEAAESACEAIEAFIEMIGMKMSLKDVKLPDEEIPALAKQSMVLPNYEADPRIAREDEMLELRCSSQ